MNYSDFHLLMLGAAIAPFLDSPMTVRQDSVLFESIGTTIVQFAPAGSKRDGTHVLAGLTQPPEVSEGAIDALQRLIQLQQQLRSSTQKSPVKSALTLEELVPYVMEEALDVLDILRTETSNFIQSPLPSPLVRLDSLVAPMLWAIARSAYPVMDVLEGMRACACLPSQSWMPGVLRLVPLLELSTPDQYWRFDLTTGRVPQNLIEPDLQIQPEKALFLDLGSAQEVDPASVHSANQQLQGLLRHLSACNPSLQVLFQGMPVDLLVPKKSWLQGNLKLSLDFEFVAQEIADFAPVFQSFQNHCVEAELLEKEPEKSVPLSSDNYPAARPLAVVELPLSLLEPTTLMRIAEQPLLEHLTQDAYRQIMATAIAHIDTVLQSPNSSDPVLAVIRTAASLEQLAEQSIKQNFSLLQPELLMDELVPKLLWQLSRSSCTIMQWIGGLSTELLQPDHTWETGTLRLMSVLALATGDRTWYIDLATGRFIPNHSWQLNSDAVVVMSGDASAISGMSAVPNSTPVRVETLLDQLLLHIQATAPDIAVLQNAIAVEWLTPEQEWQTGQLTLHWGFEWMPDVC